MLTDGARAGRPRWAPAAVLVVLLAAMGGAAVLWMTTAGRRALPTTPAELAVVLSILGAFLLRRCPGNRLAAVLALTGALFAVVTLAAAVLAHDTRTAGPGDQAALLVAWLAGSLAAPWMLVVLWFPDGRFTGGGWRRLFVAGTAFAVLSGVAGYLFGPPGRLPAMLAGASVRPSLGGPFAAEDHGVLLALVDATVLLPLVALPALVVRYRRADAMVRQQIRLVLIATATTVAGSVAAAALGEGPPAVAAAGAVLGVVVQPLPAAAIALAVLRFGLWDIDVVVSRTLVHALMWGALSLLLLVPALLSGLLVGGPGTATAVVVALVVTLVFEPVRRRVQSAVEARVFGARRRGLQQLARFGAVLGSAVEVDEVGPQVASAVRSALSVPWALVWTYLDDGNGGVLRPVGSAGIDPPPPVRPTAGVIEWLRSWRSPPTATVPPAEVNALAPASLGAMLPLVAGAEVVGLLAVARRAGEPLGPAELDPLARFAGECALGLRALRLDSELRARLDDLQAGAEELRESRQRLVAAQDDERRRIERDLHDGVQQQLVGLAAGLRRLAVRSDPRVGTDCERLAAEAEDAVFALQDLARGIFPSALADQGLAAALRAAAGRSRVAVRLDLDPGLAGRRFAPEVESALYFVALEALTNVAKHAGGAAASVVLRTAADGERLLLAVEDDGPGLPSALGRGGTGLVNMRDRTAAAGGRLWVEAVPAGGTRVRAEVPLAPQNPAQPVEADSRR